VKIKIKLGEDVYIVSEYEGESFASNRLSDFKITCRRKDSCDTFFQDLLDFIMKIQGNNYILLNQLSFIAKHKFLVNKRLIILPRNCITILNAIEYPCEWIENRIERIKNEEVKKTLSRIQDDLFIGKFYLELIGTKIEKYYKIFKDKNQELNENEAEKKEEVVIENIKIFNEIDQRLFTFRINRVVMRIKSLITQSGFFERIKSMIFRKKNILFIQRY